MVVILQSTEPANGPFMPGNFNSVTKATGHLGMVAAARPWLKMWDCQTTQKSGTVGVGLTGVPQEISGCMSAHLPKPAALQGIVLASLGHSMARAMPLPIGNSGTGTYLKNQGIVQG